MFSGIMSYDTTENSCLVRCLNTISLQKTGQLGAAGGVVSPPACLAIVICLHHPITLLATFGEPGWLLTSSCFSKMGGGGPEGPLGDS